MGGEEAWIPRTAADAAALRWRELDAKPLATMLLSWETRKAKVGWAG